MPMSTSASDVTIPGVTHDCGCYLVLSQHLIGQVVPLVLLRTALLIFTEVIFQWFASSVMGDGGSVLGTVATLGLLVSHMLMAPEVPFELLEAYRAHKKAKPTIKQEAAAASAAAAAPGAIINDDENETPSKSI